MGLFKFLKLKLRKKRLAVAVAADRVSAVDFHAYEDRADDITASTPYKSLSWDDIKKLTKDFSTVVGHGGFSTVYLAQFQDSKSNSTRAAAVKIQRGSPRLYQCFRQELDILLRVKHDRIVRLLGYCDDEEEGVLLLEYIPNGNLQEKLHQCKTPIPWKQRMIIAYQLAQAIAYLHDSCTPQIVHGDIKASNILLDENLNCKLCDFGSAKMGFSSTVVSSSSLSPDDRWGRRNRTALVGSPGYMDPLYLRTGLASKKNDVYSFGVIVLELITGIEAFCPESGERLAVRAEGMMRGAVASAVAEMVDPRLGGAFGLEEATAMAEIAAKCLCDSASLRPSAAEILTTMRSKIPFLI